MEVLAVFWEVECDAGVVNIVAVPCQDLSVCVASVEELMTCVLGVIAKVVPVGDVEVNTFIEVVNEEVVVKVSGEDDFSELNVLVAREVIPEVVGCL